MNLVRWEDICDYAQNLFNVWQNDCGIKWDKKGWDIITKAELANYSDEIERHVVIIRLMTLGIVYRQFQDLVFDECFSRCDIHDCIYDGEYINFNKIEYTN